MPAPPFCCVIVQVCEPFTSPVFPNANVWAIVASESGFRVVRRVATLNIFGQIKVRLHPYSNRYVSDRRKTRSDRPLTGYLTDVFG